MAAGESMIPVGDVPTETTTVVRVESDDGTEELMLHRTDGTVHAWLNACQHFTHIPIDKGDGAVMRDGEFICQNHGAYFEAASGRCTFGPCEGAYLESVDVTVEDGTVYLTDERYVYIGPGPIKRDPTDLGSTSNVEF